MCHFKFLHDFYERVMQEVERKQHYLNAAEYILYADLFRKTGRIDLGYSGTRRFKNAEQLVELGLIREAEWMRAER
jgi:hypothetical protein